MNHKTELKVYPGTFGKGLGIMFYVAILLFLCGCVNSGMTNTVIPAITEKNGWNYTTALSFASYASWLSIITAILFSQIVMKKGAKIVAVIGLFCGAANLFLFGNAPSLAVFCICILLNRLISTAYQNASAFTFIANWFPTKKGIAVGWATMGVIFVDIIWTPAVTGAIQRWDVSVPLDILAVIFVIVAVIGILFVKNTPEEAGAYQDNEPCSAEMVERTLKQIKQYKSPWTFKKLLSTKVVWITSIGLGLYWMAALGVSSQNVPRLVSIGYERGTATTIMSIAAIFALLGSYLFGVFDKRLGTKKACIIYGIAQTIGMCFLFFQPRHVAFVWLSLCVIYSCFGGIANLVPSMIATLFGRWDYPAANRVMYPIVSVIFGCCFKVIATGLDIWGTYTAVYIIFLAATVAGLVLVFFINDKMIGAVIEEEEPEQTEAE